MKRIADGFLVVIGAWLALNVIGLIDGKTNMSFGKKTENSENV